MKEVEAKSGLIDPRRTDLYRKLQATRDIGYPLAEAIGDQVAKELQAPVAALRELPSRG